jgi:hypothetical protein
LESSQHLYCCTLKHKKPLNLQEQIKLRILDFGLWNESWNELIIKDL